MKGQVNGKVKKARVHQLLELSDVLKEEYMKSQLNKTKSIIVEQEKDKWYMGHSKDYLSIKIKSEKNIIGSEVQVMLERIDFPNIIASIKN